LVFQPIGTHYGDLATSSCSKKFTKDGGIKMMRLKKRDSNTILVSFVVLAIAIGCSKKKSDEDDSDTDSVSSGFISSGNGVSGNPLSAAFPSELALAAFPQSSSSALRLDESVEDPNADKTIGEKVADSERKLAGSGDCFDPQEFKNFKPQESITCYDFDSDMNPFEVSGDSRKLGTTDGTNGAGEACMVSFARKELDDVANRVDRALALISGMLCIAKQNGLATALPEIGETLDLAAAMENVGPKIFEKVSTASMVRLDDVDGNAVYRSDVTITDPNGNLDEVHLVHSPVADGSSTGTLWFKRQSKSKLLAGQQVDPNNSENKNDVMSINYAKTLVDGRERMTGELRRASIVNTIDPFEDNGLVAYSNLPEDAQNADVHRIKYVAFDMFPDNNEGSLSYWMNPGGNYNESARGFLFSMEAGVDGGLSGCGVSGATAGVSIRKALAEPSETNALIPVRYWHPRGSSNISADKDARFTSNEGSFVTEQCFKQDADGVYAIDSDKTADERGYEVVARDAVEVEPPMAPPAKLDGEFKPAE
jgi:hypothetical protein